MIEKKLTEKLVEDESAKSFKTQIVWKNVIAFMLLHYFTAKAFLNYEPATFWFHFVYGFLISFGVVTGAHRLWSHRSYKANLFLQILLMLAQSGCMENDIIEWVRDHRVHHKYSETNADPHNSNRGFFFSHMGWLMCKKHPDVKKYGKKIYMDDVMNNPVLQFQRKYYIPLAITVAFILPMAFTMYFFKSSLSYSFCAAVSRYVGSLHFVWLTNSAAHIGSWKPYDKNIAASDSYFFGTILYGEGWHNYHHTFPFDYRLSDHAANHNNWCKASIEFFAYVGWATDLKVASEEMIRKRVLRTGDGTHPYAIEAAKMNKKNDVLNNNINCEGDDSYYWGLGDEDITEEEAKEIKTKI